MPYKLKIEQDTDLDGLSPRDWDNMGHMVCWHSRYNLGDEQRRDDVNEWLRELACSLDPSLEERLLYWEDGNGWTALYNKATDLVTGKLKEIDEEIAAVNLGYTRGASDHRLAELEVERKKWPWYRANSIASLESEKRITAAIMDVIDKNTVMLPLYVYEHGGITMSTGGYSCPWDSGQVGYIYATRNTVLREFGAKRLTKELREKVADIMRGEVKVYAQYLEGDVYGYVIYKIDEPCDCDPEPWNNHPPCKCTKGAEVVDSCYGFYGSDEALKEGESMVRFFESKGRTELVAGQD